VIPAAVSPDPPSIARPSRAARLRLALPALLALLLAGAASAAGAPALKAGSFDPPRMAPDFTLPGANGKPLRLREHRGKVVLLGFGFTSCAAVCPVTLATLRAANKALGAQAREVQVIYITVDPERDVAAQLGGWLAAYDPRFLGGTGNAAQLAAVRKDYGVTADNVAGPDGAITHSSFVYLIDRRGRLRGLMPFGRGAGAYVHDVRLLLAEK
jgi:protein SCO1/2